MKTKLLPAFIVVIITTILYAFIMYKADKIDRAMVSEKIALAYKDGQLQLMPVPSVVYGGESTSHPFVQYAHQSQSH